MNDIDLKDLIIKYPQILKITPDTLSEYWSYTMGSYLGELDFKSTYADQGSDDLDLVELVMNIEKCLNIVIDDSIVDKLFNVNSKPINLTNWIRNEKLEKLGIN